MRKSVEVTVSALLTVLLVFVLWWILLRQRLNVQAATGYDVNFLLDAAEETMRQHRRTSLGVLTERAELLFLATQLWILIAQHGLNIARRELSC
jgi:hypothetical protein